VGQSGSRNGEAIASFRRRLIGIVAVGRMVVGLAIELARPSALSLQTVANSRAGLIFAAPMANVCERLFRLRSDSSVPIFPAA